MSESEMVRRGARALCWVHRENRWPKCGCDSVCKELNSAVFEPEARAVIEALREPTEAMWSAPAMAEACVNGVLPSGDEAEAIWKSMIAEALR